MFFGVHVQVPLMDVAGRRPLLIIPMIVMIIDLIGMTICLILQVRFAHYCVALYCLSLSVILIVGGL